MELKFEKYIIPYLQTIAGQMQSQEQTQQIRLTDTMPDVKRIISAWGQVIVRGKQWLSGSIQVSGGVVAWVLYQGESEDKPQCVETWLPFQIECEIPNQDRDGYIKARPFLRSIDARTLSDRKIMVRANVGVMMQAIVSSSAEIYRIDDIPEDLQILKRSYPVQLPVEAGEKLINIDDVQPPIPNCKLLRCSVLPQLTESRIVSDKLVMRGNVQLDILLMDEEGKLHKWQPDLPFSQFAQLETEYNPHATDSVSFAVTEMEMDQNEEGEHRFRCSLLAQYTIYDQKILDIVEDAYSTSRSVELKTYKLSLPSLLNEKIHSIQIGSNAQQDEGQIIDVNVLMDDIFMSPEDNMLRVSPVGIFQILQEDAQGNLNGTVNKWETEFALDNDTDAEVYSSVSLDGMPIAIGPNISQQLKLELKSVSASPFTMVCEIELGETRKPDHNRPSLILCKMEDEDTWSLAKRTGSTVEAIIKANGLKQEPEEGEILLIPIS